MCVKVSQFPRFSVSQFFRNFSVFHFHTFFYTFSRHFNVCEGFKTFICYCRIACVYEATCQDDECEIPQKLVRQCRRLIREVGRMHSRFMEMNLLGYGDDEKEARGGR